MHKGDYLPAILRSAKTIFTLKDIALLWQDTTTEAARVRLNYYVKKSQLLRLRRGLYAKSSAYNNLELATRVFTPSYVSFETVLAKEGVIFQYQTTITVASYLTRTISINNQLFSYKKMKDSILTNTLGIEHKEETSIATKERALLDTLYAYQNFHVDNVRSLDWDTIHMMVPLYENKRMAQTVHQLFQQSKKIE